MIKRVCGSYHNLMVYCGFFHILQKLRRPPLPFITCVQFADVWIMSIGVIFREINVAATTGTPKFCTPGFACQKIEIEDFFCADLTCTSSSHCRFFFLIKKPKYLIPPQISRNSKQKLNPFFEVTSGSAAIVPNFVMVNPSPEEITLSQKEKNILDRTL